MRRHYIVVSCYDYGRGDGFMEVVETGWLKRETEVLQMAAQDEALPARNYKVKIMKGS